MWCASFRIMDKDREKQERDAVAVSPSQAERSPRGNLKGKRRSEEKKQSYVRKKRTPKRLSQRPNDIYVNRKSDFASQLARSHKLLDQGMQELFIHGLGAAIHRAINLSLQLKETSSYSLDISCTTSTVELVDDLEPLDDEADFKTQTRPNSAIHIRLYKTTPPIATPPTRTVTTPTHHSVVAPSNSSSTAGKKHTPK